MNTTQHELPGRLLRGTDTWAISLDAGDYVATTPIRLSLLHGDAEKEYTLYSAGDRFSVPKTINGYSYALTYCPDWDSIPACESV